VIQACIAMEHPPHLDWELAGQRDASGKINGQPVSERITKSRAAESTWNDPRFGLYINEGASPSGTGLVHFDIDPQNGKHSNVPLPHERCPVSFPTNSSCRRPQYRTPGGPPRPGPRFESERLRLYLYCDASYLCQRVREYILAMVGWAVERSVANNSVLQHDDVAASG
jgi:hypothetical protein